MISNELLKKKILDAAVHGKLVENENLYIKDIYQNYESKNELFDIPSNWKWINLESICQIIFSAPSPKYSISENSNYCLGQKNNQSYGLDLTGMKYCTDEFMKNYRKEYYLHKGDVLLNSLGTGSVGRIGIFDLENDKYITDGHLLVFRHNSDLNEKFLFYVMKYFEKLFEKMAIGSTHQAFLKINTLKNFEIPFCSLEEQEKIVKKIEELFELIDKKEKNDQEKEKLKTLLKEKILNSAINGQLVENDLSLPVIDVEEVKDNIPFEIPNNWRWTTFNKIIDVRDGTHDSPKYVEYSDYPLITSKNLTKNGLDFENVNYLAKKDYESINVRSFVDDGDILFAMIGSIGNPVLVNKTRNFAIKNVALFKCSEKIYNKYLYYYLQSQGDMSDKTKGGVQKFVSLKILRNYLIPIPPLEQQKKIVDKIEKCFELIEQL